MLIEPTETEAVENLDSMADAFLAIAKEVRENPAIVLGAPSTTPISRVDDALAARNLNISYFGKR
jgi:glycine dehydrogenase subunit 2